MNGPDLPSSTDPLDNGGPDPIDELLRRRVQRAAADAPTDAEAELAELAPRFRRARRNRQVAVAAMSSAAAVVLLVVGAFAFGADDAQRVDTADDGRAATSTTVPTTSTSSTTTSTTAPAPAVTAPVTTTSIAGSGDGGGGAGGDDGPGVTGPPPTTSVAPSPTAVPTTTPVGGTTTLVAEGGTATVRWDATSIAVLGTSPASGWTLEQVEQASPTRVVVKFRRDGGGQGSSSSTIDARVVDGALRSDS